MRINELHPHFVVLVNHEHNIQSWDERRLSNSSISSPNFNSHLGHYKIKDTHLNHWIKTSKYGKNNQNMFDKPLQIPYCILLMFFPKWVFMIKSQKIPKTTLLWTCGWWNLIFLSFLLPHFSFHLSFPTSSPKLFVSFQQWVSSFNDKVLLY